MDYETPLVNTDCFQVDSWLSDFMINYFFYGGGRQFSIQFYFFFFNEPFQTMWFILYPLP